MITIKYDRSCDMMEILNGESVCEEIFCGNMYYFKADPKSLK